LRKLAFLATVFAVLSFASLASAQQGDAYFGGGTLLSPSGTSGTPIFGTNCSTASNGGVLCPQKGGTYLNIGADAIFRRRLGAAFDVNWKATQGSIGGPGGQPYRPIQYTFNGMYQPRITKKVGAELFGGIGWQTTRFYSYQNTTSCLYFGACYNSSNHFLIDLGGGVRYYFFGHMFVRPEIRYYYVLNNTDTSGSTGIGFTSNNIFRVGASIGYTIGPD
jgi:Outer membrane protein beta-barrel domain